MSESAPKSTIILDVDAQGVTTGVNAAKKELKDLGNTAKKVGDEFDKGGKQAEKAFDPAEKKIAATTRTTNALVNQLKNSIIDLKSAGDAATKYELRGLDKNIPSAVTAPLVAELRKLQMEQAAAAASALAASNSIAKTIVPTLEKTGMTAKATAAAMRSVPAQFTDIVVSLQGGQAPLTVLLQQGGQLKDMFGGIGAAARALGSYIAALINPFTVVAGVAAGLAFAYESGAKESRAFSNALILSGNQSGATASQLMAMAASIDQVSGTQSGAAEALALFAGSGKIAAENLEKFTLTAIRFEKVSGVAVTETVKKFEELRKAPLEATLRLNDALGYMTAELYNQIKALTEQGRMTEAATLAQVAFDRATADMTANMAKNLGYLERAWNGVTSAVKEALDAVKGIGRDTGLEGQVAAARKMVEVRTQAANSIYANDSDRGKLSEAENQLKGYEELLKNQRMSAEQSADRVKSAKELSEFDKRGEAYLDRSVKIERALAVERVAAGKLLKDGLITQEQYATRLQKIALSGVDKPKAAGRAPRAKTEVDESAKGVALYNDLISKGAGFTANYAEQMASLAKSASLGGLSVTQVAEAAALLNAQQPGTIALVKAENEAFDAALKTIDANDKLTLSYEEARIAAASYIDTINKQAAREVAGAGRGSKFRESQRGLNAIDDKLTDKKSDLSTKLDAGMDKALYDKYLALANDTYQQELGIYTASREAMAGVQGSWSLGASEGLSNYLDQTKDVYSQISDVVGGAFKGMEDALVDFVQTGKLDFSSLANSIVADLARIAIQRSITGPLASALGLSMFSANGNAFSGAGEVQKFAKGGTFTNKVVDTPTLFKFAKGTGMMGEAGPEAIMPLSKMANGKLGVQSVGDEKPSSTTTNHINMNFTVGDVASVTMVRQAVANSQRQLVAALGRSTNYGGAIA